jgi:hypothetical protein
MFRRTAHLWAAGAALLLYGAMYLLAWSVVWRVPEADRDGLEWVFVGLMTLPWSLLAGDGGWGVVHAGAVVNALLQTACVGWIVRDHLRG